MHHTRPAAAAALIALLAGCGGGSTSGDGGYQSLLTDYADLKARADLEARTDPLPVAGTADYAGVARYQLGASQANLASNVDMTVNFGGGPAVSGQLTNFFVKVGNAPPVPMTGVITLSQIPGAPPGGFDFALRPDGAIQGGGLTILVDDPLPARGSLVGQFRGPNGEFLTGTIAFISNVNGAESGGTLLATPLSGDFYAERQ